MSQVSIKGMSCQHCVASVREALEKIPEIENIVVDLEKGEARFDGDVDRGVLEEAITKTGFEVE